MALTLAVLADCQKILNQLLNRNRLAWSASGGTGANELAAYKFDEEIVAALLLADGLVITEVYFQAEQSFRNRFMVESDSLATGDKLPEFSGLIGKCEASAYLDSVPHTFTDSAINTSTTDDYITFINTYVGGEMVYMTTDGTLPNTTTGMLTIDTQLYIIKGEGNRISVSRTLGGPKIVFTDQGSGNHTFTSGAVWRPSREVLVKDDITGANECGTYVGPVAFAGMHHFQDGYVFHSSASFRMTYPEYVRTAALQSLQQHESLIVNWACELLYKEHANAGFAWYREIRKELAAAVYAGSMRLKAPQPLPANLRG